MSRELRELRGILKRPTPCQYQLPGGSYCGKPSRPVSNYCRKHGRKVLEQIKKREQEGKQ